MAKGCIIIQAALLVLLAVDSTTPAFAASSPTLPADKSASIADYLPELQQLQRQADWAGLERVSRRALSALEAQLGPENTNVGDAANWLAVALQEESRYAEAEPLFRRALAIDEKVLGPEHPLTATALDNLARLLLDQGHYGEAEPLYRRALAIDGKALGPEHPGTATALDNLAGLLLDQGHYGEAEPLYRRALAIDEKALGPNHPGTATNLDNLALLLHSQGHYGEAEPLYRRALAIDEKALGPEHPNTATDLNNLAWLLWDQGQYGEAEPLYRRALAIDEKALGPEHPGTIIKVNNLAALLEDQGRYGEAEPLYRRALATDEKALGPNHPGTATILDNLALLLHSQGHYGEAEPLYRRALAIDEKALGRDHPVTATVLNNLAGLLQRQGHYGEAERLYQRALAIDEKALGPDHPETVLSFEQLGGNERRQGKVDEASGNYRIACSTQSSLSHARSQHGDAAKKSRSQASTCSTSLSLSLWSWSSQGGGSAAADRPDALQLEAFRSTQGAVQSAAGDALARSAALTAAKSAGVGDEARAYEAALLERDGLDRLFASAAGNGAVERRQALTRARADAVVRIDRLAAELTTKAPRYWDYRSPEPVSAAALQAKTGANAVLLHHDEALLMFLVPPGKDKGLVFAVSRDKTAWAQIGLTGDELRTRVTRLRAQIDPVGYGLRSAVQTGGPGTGSSHPGFDRQAAFELYQALLGETSIQAVIKDKPVLLFVPSGPLTSLPPGLLVTAPPVGGPAGDADPTVLRATPWLLRSKAVALLPSVSTLRTLRQLLPVSRAAAPDPLLAFADPDFAGTAAKTTSATPAQFTNRGFNAYFRDAHPVGEALSGLPRLPGTRIEGEALVTALGGRPGSLLTGRDASKAQLMDRNDDGRLAKVRVLEFATHGLVSGDVSGLAEPALVLAAGGKPEDQLLLASEAATLKLNADWVLLSACNTASPDAPEAQGLSGLSRAFFYAGARSLLVSHWRVRDDVAAQLIPAMLLAERRTPGLSRAQALRRASLAVLDDPTLDAAQPSAWAPFTLIGEAGR